LIPYELQLLERTRASPTAQAIRAIASVWGIGPTMAFKVRSIPAVKS